jgi:hypothetical protein
LFNGFFSHDLGIYHRPDAVVFQDGVLVDNASVNVIVVDRVTKMKPTQV